MNEGILQGYRYSETHTAILLILKGKIIKAKNEKVYSRKSIYRIKQKQNISLDILSSSIDFIVFGNSKLVHCE